MPSSQSELRTIAAAMGTLDVSWFDREFGPPSPGAIFDFDGVLCGPAEDLAYRLPEAPNERLALERQAREHRLVPELYKTPYLRHLVLQAELESRAELPQAGPLLLLAQQLSAERRPFFILTARSGLAAVSRVLAFLDHNSLAPQEVFFVGRVAKGRQLSLARATVPKDIPLVYFEDTVRHARNSHKQDNSGLTTVFVEWETPPWREAEALVDQTLGSGNVRIRRFG